MTGQQSGVAVIMDLVGSRRQPDRADAQRQLEAALIEVNAAIPAMQPVAPTIGDESQGAYADLGSALRATLLLRLCLPAPLDCRFGLGGGTWEIVGRSEYGPMQDGPAWWAAREAIVEAKSREVRRHKSLRSWYAVADGDAGVHPPVGLTNSLLMCRDEIVSGMSDRTRRLALGLLRGRTQVELAQIEGISQSAVSQNLQRGGAFALLGSTEVLR
ncbi:SatD family protein [Aeromicrobium sp.]|uniref:SatD family protein n=1 Tax=Aeromicrobium sp. TaxID=1871063 RepID=UPI0030C2DF97